MAATPDALFRRLDTLGIRHVTRHHPPVHTVTEAAALTLPGAQCKCLFLRDRKGGLWLVAALADRPIDLKALAERLAAPRFSFASPALLQEALGVAPGSVTPFALLNDRERRVRVVLDAGMLTVDPLNFHPLVNTASTALSPGDLRRFINDCGHTPLIVDLAGLERGAG
ncbi:MAG TPA: prolyl-tRNA synthetase associated domain-containing protein [Stellaceae bacterium]|nr:prolyl-tRNA synthetase associated domain-containing protein [Stellaceae bacterium]